MLVFDATPLIYLAKVEKLHLLQDISKEKVIPRSVFEEDVITKREAREIVDGIIERGWFCSTYLYARILRKLEEE